MAKRLDKRGKACYITLSYRKLSVRQDEIPYKGKEKEEYAEGDIIQRGQSKVEDCRGRVAAEGSFGAGMENKK